MRIVKLSTANRYINPLLFTLILLICNIPLWGQATEPKLSGAEKQADEYVISQQFEKAQEAFKSILEKKNLEPAVFKRVNLKLASMLYSLRQYTDAEEVFKQVSADYSAFTPDQATSYVYTLIQLNKINEAAEILDKFLSRHPFSAEISLQNLQNGLEKLKHTSDYTTYAASTAPFNQNGTNFWCALQKEGIIFIHVGADMIKGAQYFCYDGINVSPYTKVELTMQAGPATFSTDNTTMLYTDNRYGNKAPRRLKDSKLVFNSLRILQLSYNAKKDSWEKPQEQFKTKTDDSYCHPALSNDGKRLYFSSDRPGGAGGLDLYMATKTEKGWSEPVNLGKAVNTEDQEVFPFVYGDKLYFSSNGLKGIGGQDIYVVTLDKEGFPKPNTLENMPYPINTPYNDYAFMHVSDVSGYLSSDRPNGENLDMIYTWSKPVSTPNVWDNSLDVALNIPERKLEKPVVLAEPRKPIAKEEVVMDAVDVAKDLISGLVTPDATIYYGFNKKVLTTEATLAINDFLAKLGTERPKLLVLGYADAIGGGASNKVLSEQRAEAVKEYLVKKKGYPAEQIEAIGKGQLQLDETEIVADAKDEKERLAAARKAEIKLLEATTSK